MQSKIKIGIITALPKELATVRVLLENVEEYPIDGVGAGRRYFLGNIPTRRGGVHKVVLALTTGIGNNQAAIRAKGLIDHFNDIESIIMVGIAGGVPNPEKPDEHVRLGDVVISDEKGVIQYDFIKQEIDKIKMKSPSRPPSASLIEAVKFLEADELEGKRPWIRYIRLAEEKIKTERPLCESDKLFDYDVDFDENLDLIIKNKKLINHPKDLKRIPDQPRIFRAPIAAANTLLKNPKYRDKLRDEYGVKAVEMEGSGIADATWDEQKGYLVVRGICDYCDPEKNDDWQQYAAIVAAAYTIALIESIPTPIQTTGGGVTDSIENKNKEFIESRLRRIKESTSKELITITIFILPKTLDIEPVPYKEEWFKREVALRWSDNHLGDIMGFRKDFRYKSFLLEQRKNYPKKFLEIFEISEKRQVIINKVFKREPFLEHFKISISSINLIIFGLHSLIKYIFKDHVKEFDIKVILDNIQGCYLGEMKNGAIQVHTLGDSLDAGPQRNNVLELNFTINFEEYQNNEMKFRYNILNEIMEGFGITKDFYQVGYGSNSF